VTGARRRHRRGLSPRLECGGWRQSESVRETIFSRARRARTASSTTSTRQTAATGHMHCIKGDVAKAAEHAETSLTKPEKRPSCHARRDGVTMDGGIQVLPLRRHRRMIHREFNINVAWDQSGHKRAVHWSRLRAVMAAAVINHKLRLQAGRRADGRDSFRDQVGAVDDK